MPFLKDRRWIPYENERKFETLKGKTLSSILVDENYQEIRFNTTEGETYILFHDQDCCESVTIESIEGDIGDLIGSPILMAEEIKEYGRKEEGVYTWTFYKLATVKGYVTIRWYGESNGYYSERVDFYLYTKRINNHAQS